MQSWKAASCTNLTVAKYQREQLQELKKSIVVPIFSGRPLLLEETAKNSDARGQDLKVRMESVMCCLVMWMLPAD